MSEAVIERLRMVVRDNPDDPGPMEALAKELRRRSSGDPIRLNIDPTLETFYADVLLEVNRQLPPLGGDWTYRLRQSRIAKILSGSVNRCELEIGLTPPGSDLWGRDSVSIMATHNPADTDGKVVWRVLVSQMRLNEESSSLPYLIAKLIPVLMGMIHDKVSKTYAVSDLWQRFWLVHNQSNTTTLEQRVSKQVPELIDDSSIMEDVLRFTVTEEAHKIIAAEIVKMEAEIVESIRTMARKRRTRAGKAIK